MTTATKTNEAKWLAWQTDRVAASMTRTGHDQVVKLKLSNTALDDHMDRLYETKTGTQYAIAYDGDAVIWCGKRGKKVTQVVCNLEATNELLGDFDYYADALENGALDDDCRALAKSMRNAAATIRKQLATNNK